MFGFFKKDKPAAPEAVAQPEIAPAAVAQDSAPEAAAPKMSWAQRLRAGLSKTRAQIGGQLSALFSRTRVDDELLEELETLLITSDVGLDATTHLLDVLRERVRRERIEDPAKLRDVLKEALTKLITPLEKPLDLDAHKPFIIMIAGVNGAGKTTSIGKLAKHFQAQGKSVLLAAGDTFRAAAREQLETWGARNNVAVIAQDSGDRQRWCSTR